MMKDDDFKLLGGFANELTNRRTDICYCRVAFATEKDHKLDNCIILHHDYPLSILVPVSCVIVLLFVMLPNDK